VKGWRLEGFRLCQSSSVTYDDNAEGV